MRFPLSAAASVRLALSAALAAIVLLAAAGCGSSSPESASSPSAAPSVTAPPLVTWEGLGYQSVCGGHGSGKAAAYKPGTEASIDFEENSDASGGGVEDANGILDEGSVAQEPESWIPATVTKVALVGCITDSGITKKVDQTCSYTDGSTVTVYYEKFTIALRVARTGKLLVAQTVDGTDFGLCPQSIVSGQGGGGLQTWPSLDDVETVIQGYFGH